jgi:hypothetical protein
MSDEAEKQGPPKPGNPPAISTPEAAPAAALTPEEQMALYEQDLKENDWGHQPC